MYSNTFENWKYYEDVLLYVYANTFENWSAASRTPSPQTSPGRTEHDHQHCIVAVAANLVLPPS